MSALSRSIKPTTFLLLVLGMLCGCSTSPPPQPEAGWHRYDNQVEAFSIAVPNEWTEYSTPDESKSEAIAMISKLNPRLATSLEETVKDPKQKFQALNLTQDALANGSAASCGIIPSIRVFRQPQPGEGLKSYMPIQLKSIQNKYADSLTSKVEERAVDLPGAHAFRLKYTFTSPASTGTTIENAVTQYFTVAGGGYYLLSMIACASQNENYIETFEKAANSFRSLR